MKAHAELTEKEAEYLVNLLNGPPFKKGLKILNRLFAESLSYTQGDTHHTAFREGQRSVVDFLNNASKAEVVKNESNVE